MIQYVLNYLLVLSLLLGSLPVSSAPSKSPTPQSAVSDPTKDCPDGKCVEELTGLIEAKVAQAKKDKCLPPVSVKNQTKWFEENTLPLSCFRQLKELDELVVRLQKLQAYLAGQLIESDEVACRADGSQAPFDLSRLSQLDKVAATLSCTEERKKEIWNRCGSDASCVLVSSALSVAGPFAEKILPKGLSAKGCSATNDNCLTQLALGFVKSAFNFFEGAWGLLKKAGTGIANTAKDFWGWVSGAEAQSSTAQLAAATASEDEGIFQQLKKDFSGTMAKLWTGLLATIKHWLANSMFCQEWSGKPQFSTCKRPAQGLDCTECKAMITGMCALTGVLVSEVIPAFITGGIVTILKHGVSGASKASKMIKVSVASSNAIRRSKIASMVLRPATVMTQAIRTSKYTVATLKALELATRAIARFMVKPSIVALKRTLGVMSTVMRASKTYVMLTPAGPAVAFGTKAAAVGLKTILFPFENALMVKSFQLGEKAFDKVFTKVGSAKFFSGVRPALTGEAARALSAIDDAYIEMQVTKWTKRYGSQFIVQAEEKYLQKLIALRPKVIDEYLARKPNVPFSKLVEDIYPELSYGKYAEHVKTPDVLKAESQVFDAIMKMSDETEQTRLFQEYERHVSSKARADGLIDTLTFTRPQVLKNAGLESEERVATALKLANIDPNAIPAQTLERLKLGLLKAHDEGSGSVYNYSFKDIRAKQKILSEAGFTNRQAELLIRAGLAGKPPPRVPVKLGPTQFSGHNMDIVPGKHPDQAKRLKELLVSKLDEKSSPQLEQEWIQDVVMNHGVTPAKAKELVKANWSSSDEVSDWLDSLYFVDYRHSAPRISNIVTQNRWLKEIDPHDFYGTLDFKNFKETHSWVKQGKAPVELKTLQEIHKRMMAGGVEDVRPSELGKIRDEAWYGGVDPREPLSAEVIQNIKDNPYLSLRNLRGDDSKGYVADIFYPNLVDVKPAALAKISKKSPSVVAEIRAYQKILQQIEEKKGALAKADAARRRSLNTELDQLYKRAEAIEAQQGPMNARLVEALTQERIDWYNTQRAKLGALDSPKKIEKFADLIAEFQRDLVSIHPLINGNGRSTREFAFYLTAAREGLPPPRLIDPDADIYMALDDYKKVVRHGMVSTDHLYDDLIERATHDLQIDDSLFLATPYHSPPVRLDARKEGSVKVVQSQFVEYVDPSVYREALQRLSKSDPEVQGLLLSSMGRSQVEVWTAVDSKVKDYIKKNNLWYHSNKKGLERLELGLADKDFISFFQRRTFADASAWNYKMSRWYSKDELMWRGLANLDRVVPESEILHKFKDFDPHMVSNSVLNRMGRGTPAEIQEAALKDLELYNRSIGDKGEFVRYAEELQRYRVAKLDIADMAKHHSESGSLYGESFGFSTSKNREVGKAFSMGAMVVADYGKHRTPELQQQILSRILVGGRRSVKDVDLTRLRQLRQEKFSYKYGRQQEIMGIGAADPDSVMIVQTISATGEVELSYLRNAEKPWEVWIIRGDIRPGTVPTKEQILKTVDLRQP